MKNKTVAIVICTEPGSLECMSQLLVKSIRRYGGALKDTNIYSVQPRSSELLSHKTLEVFNKFHVHHEHKLINSKYYEYGFANKIAACNYYAQKLSEDYLLFLDSDNVVFNDLKLLLDDTKDIQVSVANLKGVGSNGKDENANYWNTLHDLCGVKAPGFTRTVIDGKKVFCYYNGGLIFAKRTSGLFQQWHHNFDLVMHKNLKPNQGLFFVEQSTLSATISGTQLTVRELPFSFNYSPQAHFNLSGTTKQLSLDQIHTFHYHHLFKPPNKINLQRDFQVFQGEKLDWLKQELVNCGINSKPFYALWELDLIASKDQLIQQMKNNQAAER